MTGETIARCISMLDAGQADELRALLDRELYMAMQGRKSGASQKLATLNAIIKTGEKTNNLALSGAFIIPGSDGMTGYCDGYRAIRTREEYPTARIEANLNPIKLGDIFSSTLDGMRHAERSITVDRVKLAAAKTRKVKCCQAGGICFDVAYLHSMIQFFDTDTFTVRADCNTAPAYFKNDSTGEDGILCPVRADNLELAENIAA